MKVSDYVVRFLAIQGVTHVYELAGGMLAHLLDSFSKQDAVRLVSMHHEQAAAFAAEGHARTTGVPGVALATSGPGATNLLTAIGSCYFDSTPAVFITGQVNRNEVKGERAIRQLGFQETDIVSIARPITKLALQIQDEKGVAAAFERAFETALSGRKGPVLIDLPMDVQRQHVPLQPLKVAAPCVDPARVARADVDAAVEMLRSAERPLVLAGGGIRAAGAVDAFRRAVDHLQVPVVHSLMGLDALPHGHPLRVGMIGSYGNRWANHALGQCDALLVVGSRLDIRQTGTDTEGFGARRIVQVDCDPAEVNNRVRGVRAVVNDISDFLAAVLEVPAPRASRAAWLRHVRDLESQWPDTAELKDLEGLNPNLFLRRLGAASPEAVAFVVDVGQHQMWAGQSLAFREEQRFMTSGGMGSMGFALPAAIGVAMAAPRRPIVVVAGDGGFQLNIQELQTVVRNALPIKIVVMNNGAHGMVRQFQESYFESRYQSTVIGYSAPDFARVAGAYGISSRRLDGAAMPAARAQDEAIDEALRWLWEDASAPRLLDVRIPLAANVYPKLAFGRPITEMEPDAKPLEMEGT